MSRSFTLPAALPVFSYLAPLLYPCLLFHEQEIGKGKELSANHFGFLSIPLGNCLHDVKIWGSHGGWCLILPGCPDPCNRGDRM